MNAMAKVRAELEKCLEAVKALQVNPSDMAARSCLRWHMDDTGRLIIGNVTLMGEMMEEVGA